MEWPIVLVALVALVTGASIAIWLQARVKKSSRELETPPSAATVIEVPDAQAVTEVVPVGFIALPTDRLNEFYLLGEPEAIDGVGKTLMEAPPQLARYASGIRATVDGARTYGESVGRLVLVDEKTAAAMRAGAMARDRSGEMLAIAKDANGRFRSVARLRQVGGAVASISTLSNALSAMALQAQLDRIERKLSAISESVDGVAREQLLEWHAETKGAQDALSEVFRTGQRAGELSAANWSQIASMGHVIRKQINGDRQRLADLVAQLERSSRVGDIKVRESESKQAVIQVANAHAALVESTRAWVQFSALRLWRFTVSDEPALMGYKDELEKFMRESHDSIEPLRLRALKAAGEIDRARWHRRAQRPIVNRRLTTHREQVVSRISTADWTPLELRPPSRELTLFQSKATSR